MEIEVTMPDLSTTGSEVTVLRWLVNVGQPIKRGQALCEVETDKAIMEVESVDTGALKTQIAQPGDSVAIGEVIAVLEVERSIPVSEKPKSNEESLRRPVRPLENAPAAQPPSSSETALRTVPSSPAQMGMFAKNRHATKPSLDNRVSFAMTSSQRVVGHRMLQSKQTIPHFYLQTSVNAEPIVARRAAIDSDMIVWDAFFVCAIAKSLQRFPRMSCRINDDQLVAQHMDTVGVAIDIDGELYVIPVTNASSKTPQEASLDIRDAAGRLRTGDPGLMRLHAADITITNLGVANIESFLPIVNPPEAAILGIGRIAPQATVVDSALAIQHRASLTLAVDHRIVNGRYAADFLVNVVEEIESAV
jgi:pyruvate dehydrogenase E2 component (dihydrolipoamide acetyltransferase)